MNTHALSAHHLTALASAALAMILLSPAVLAQQLPITGAMLAGQPPTLATTPAPEPTRATPATTAQPANTIALAPSSAPMAETHQPAEMTAAEHDYPSTPSHTSRRVGDTTRHLLQMQASGSRAGAHLPMLGDQASASYQRYLKSFEHPIPEFYEATVGKDGGSGR